LQRSCKHLYNLSLQIGEYMATIIGVGSDSWDDYEVGEVQNEWTMESIEKEAEEMSKKFEAAWAEERYADMLLLADEAVAVFEEVMNEPGIPEDILAALKIFQEYVPYVVPAIKSYFLILMDQPHEAIELSTQLLAKLETLKATEDKENYGDMLLPIAYYLRSMAHFMVGEMELAVSDYKSYIEFMEDEECANEFSYEDKIAMRLLEKKFGVSILEKEIRSEEEPEEISETLAYIVKGDFAKAKEVAKRNFDIQYLPLIKALEPKGDLNVLEFNLRRA
jgi:hypothetical protein